MLDVFTYLNIIYQVEPKKEKINKLGSSWDGGEKTGQKHWFTSKTPNTWRPEEKHLRESWSLDTQQFMIRHVTISKGTVCDSGSKKD